MRSWGSGTGGWGGGRVAVAELRHRRSWARGRIKVGFYNDVRSRGVLSLPLPFLIPFTHRTLTHRTRHHHHNTQQQTTMLSPLRTLLPAVSRRAATASIQVRNGSSAKFQSSESPPIVTEKDHELDVQSHSSKMAHREKERGDHAKGVKQDPKKENPKAPEPVIGMQDERGASKFS